jgi:LPXTG-motif cell wall-anchored protein
MGRGGLGCGCAPPGLGIESPAISQGIRQRLASFFNPSSVPADGGSPAVDDGMSTVAIVGIAGAGVVVAGGLGWWLLRRRRAAA